MNTDFQRVEGTAVFTEAHGAVRIAFICVYPCPSVVNFLVVNEN